MHLPFHPHHAARPASHAHRPSDPSTAMNLQIPSLSDSLPLDAALFVPDFTTSTTPSTPAPLSTVYTSIETPSFPPPTSTARTHKKRAAVISHPYAPLGGTRNDGVVRTLANVLLKKGYVVCTFNFRGAGRSKGRTSWTGRAEAEDYKAVAGWVAAFVGALPTPLHGVDTAQEEEEREVEVEVICAGYSYGALIAAGCNAIPTGGAAAKSKWEEARQAAVRSAEEWYSSHSPEGRTSYTGPRPSHRLSTSSSTNRPKPHDGDPPKQQHPDAQSPPPPPPPLPRKSVSSRKNTQIRLRYLLISPPLRPVSSLLLLGTGGLPCAMTPLAGAVDVCAVWGDEDVFTGVKKYRRWAAEMDRASKIGGEGEGGIGMFVDWWKGIEVSGAGHFWGEREMDEVVRGVEKWVVEERCDNNGGDA